MTQLANISCTLPFKSITNQPIQMSNDDLAEKLASKSLDSALDKRDLGEKIADFFADFFGWTKYEDVITACWNVAHAPTTVAVQNASLDLASLAENPRQFANEYTLETGKATDGSHYVKASLSGQLLSTTWFDQEVEWDSAYFKFNEEKKAWQLSEQAVLALECRENSQKLAASENSVALQSNLLKLLAEHPEAKDHLRLKVEAKDPGSLNTLVTVFLSGIPLEKMMFGGPVALDLHLFTKNEQTGDFQLNNVDFNEYRAVFTDLYCPEGQVAKMKSQPQIVLDNPIIKDSDELQKMQLGEQYSYEDPDFARQVCKDFPRHLGMMPQDEQMRLTQDVIQFFAPKLISALGADAKAIYSDFSNLPKQDKKALVALLQKPQDSSPNVHSSPIAERFHKLSPTEKEAFLKLAERNVELAFDPDELKQGPIDSLGRIAQISHQGTLVVAGQVTQVLGKKFGETSISSPQKSPKKLDHKSTSLQPSESKLSYSWPLHYTESGWSSINPVETEILQATIHQHFKTSADEKSPIFLTEAAKKVKVLEQTLAEAKALVESIQLQVNAKAEEEKNLDKPSEGLAELKSKLSSQKKEMPLIEKELKNARIASYPNTVTVKLVRSELEVKLAQPEVANAAPRIIDQGSSTTLSAPVLQVDSNLRSGHNLNKAVEERESETATDLPMTNWMLLSQSGY